MILVTGDVHGFHDFEKLRHERLQSLTADDYIIICGDAGLIWVPDEKQYPDVWENKREAIERYVKEEEAALEWLSKQPWTTLFVDGNHENFPRLYQFPVKDFHGGKAAQINDKIWHLKRGEVFEICGKKIFAMGGATSVDKDQRITGVSWWPEEVPTAEEWQNAYSNLDKYRWKVDYVITHSVPESVRREINIPFERRHDPVKLTDEITLKLEEIYKRLKFKNWYAGHWHLNELMQKEKVYLLYQIIVFAGGPTTQKGNATYQMIESAKRGWLNLAETWRKSLRREKVDVAKLPEHLRPKVCTYFLYRAVVDGMDTPNRMNAYMRKLMRLGADINARDEGGYTLAMLAAYHGQLGRLETLIKAGADLSVSRDGKTTLSLLYEEQAKWQEILKQENAMDLIGDGKLKHCKRMIKLVEKRLGNANK